MVSKTCLLSPAPENRRRDVGTARTGGTLLSETAGGQETRLLTAPKPAEPGQSGGTGREEDECPRLRHGDGDIVKRLGSRGSRGKDSRQYAEES